MAAFFTELSSVVLFLKEEEWKRLGRGVGVQRGNMLVVMEDLKKRLKVCNHAGVRGFT